MADTLNPIALLPPGGLPGTQITKFEDDVGNSATLCLDEAAITFAGFEATDVKLQWGPEHLSLSMLPTSHNHDQ